MQNGREEEDMGVNGEPLLIRIATADLFLMTDAKYPVGKDLEVNAREPLLSKCVSWTNITSAPESLKLLNASWCLKFELRPLTLFV